MRKLKKPFYTRLDIRNSYMLPKSEQMLVDVIMGREDAIDIVARLASQLNQRDRKEFSVLISGKSTIVGNE